MNRNMSKGSSAAANEKEVQRLNEEEKEIRKELIAIDDDSMQETPVIFKPKSDVNPSSSQHSIINTNSEIASNPTFKQRISVPRSKPLITPIAKKKYAIPRSQPVYKKKLTVSTDKKGSKICSGPTGEDEKAQKGRKLQAILLECEVEVRYTLGILRGTPPMVHRLGRGEPMTGAAFRLTRPQDTEFDLARLPSRDKFDGSMRNLVVLGFIRENCRAGKYRNEAAYLEDMKRFCDSTKRFYRVFVPELLTRRSYKAIERHSELLLEAAIDAVESHREDIGGTRATSDVGSRLGNVLSRGKQFLGKRRHPENAEQCKRFKAEPNGILKPIGNDDKNPKAHDGLETIIERSVTTAVEKLAAQSDILTKQKDALERILIVLGDNKAYLDQRLQGVENLVKDNQELCKSLGQKFEALSSRVDDLAEKFVKQTKEPNLAVDHSHGQEHGEPHAERGHSENGSSSSESSSEGEASSSSESSGE